MKNPLAHVADFSTRLARLCLTLSASCLAQNVVDPTAPAAQEFVAELKLDQAADQMQFERAGFERASSLLSAVMNRGIATSATPQEWTEMHRAIAGLIELSVAKGELFKAAVYANLQDVHYRNDEGDYGAALAAARQALELQQRSGQTATLYIDWKNIGENLIRLGNVEEGLDALYQARQAIDNPSSSISAIIWREIVDGEIARQNLDAAQRECDGFLRQADASSSALFRGRALLTRSRLEMEAGRYNDALNSIRAAGQDLVGDKDAVTFSYESLDDLLSMVLLAMNSIPYNEAMDLAHRIEREFPDLPIAVSAEARRAMDYRRRLAGQFDALLREDATALAKAREDKNIAAQIALLRSLSVTYYFANDKRQPITLLQEALLLEKSILPADGIPANAGSQDSYFRLLATLASAYANGKDTQNARRVFNEITRGIDALPDAASKSRLVQLYGEAELGKALVEELEHHGEAAREGLKNALNATATGPARFTRSAVLLQAARLERNLEAQPLEAVRYYEAAIQAFHAERDVRTEIATRLQLARYLAVEAAGRLPDAQRRASEQLRLVETAATAIEFAEAQWRVRFLQGIVAENELRTQDAIDLYVQAIAKLDRLRAGLSQQEQRQAFMDNESIQELYQRLIALLTAAGRKTEAWEYLERGKARSFLETLQGRRFRTDFTKRASKDPRSLEKQIIDLRAQLGRADGAAGGASTQRDIVRFQLQNAEARFALARQEASLHGERAGQELALRPLRIEALQAKLPARSALIEYALLAGKITVFVITRERVVQAVWRADIEELRSQTEGARELLGHPESIEELRPLLRSLSTQLIQPLLSQIPPDTHTLLIIPAGFLNYLPFQVLPIGDGRDLIDRFVTTYLPSASALAFLPRTERMKGKLFLGAIGNVSVDGMPPLPGTLSEVHGIAQAYPNPQMAVEKAFTYERLRRALKENPVVHLATHGVLNKDSPLFNALLTSPARGQPSRLSLYELTDMKLKARLVVLSACETGLGELRKGDEITSLTRMFLQAGANSVVASLWSVSDRATAQLMRDFYQRVQGGQTPAQALRSAALKVRQHYPHPYYWAPFVLTGAY